MARINLGSGRWFETDKARCYGEDTRWDGHNHISVATGSQWEHEELYRTAAGAWILHHWSQWQGSRAEYEIVDAETARVWLTDNDKPNAVRKHFGEAADLAAEV